MRLCLSLAALALVLATSQPARADELDLESVAVVVRQVASENLSRLRRSVAFGPRLSVAGLHAADPVSSFDAQLTAGLALYTFQIPLTFEVQEVIAERVRARLLSHLKKLADENRTPSRDDILSEGRALYEQVADEVLGRHERRDRTFEKPRVGLALEGGYQPRARAGVVRLTPSVGIGPLTLGLSLAAHLRDNPTFYLGPEASVRITPADGPRPTVYEPFVRVELPALQRDRYGVQTMVGLRLLFDLI